MKIALRRFGVYPRVGERLSGAEPGPGSRQLIEARGAAGGLTSSVG